MGIVHKLNHALVLMFFSICFFASGALLADDIKPGVVLEFHLSPAGSFRAKTETVKGTITQKDGKITADHLEIQIDSLKTDIDLRDKHLHEHLESEKFPTASLDNATGQGGKGKGTLTVHGVPKEIQITYKALSGNLLQAEFTVHIDDFKVAPGRYMGIGVKDEVKGTVILPVRP